MHFTILVMDPTQIAGTCVMQTLRAAARAVTQLYEAALAPFDLTASQFSTLVAAAAGSGETVSRMADTLGTDRTTLSRVLGPLERRGLIASAPDRHDARTRVVTLTAEGRALLSEAVVAWADCQSRVVAMIGEAAWSDIRRGLGRLKQE